MLREQMVSLLRKSIHELMHLDDYSKIFYKMKIADNYSEGGIFSSVTRQPDYNYLISYPDSIEFFKIYNNALLTEERFNLIEINFDKEMNAETTFTWDQEYYDKDVRGNKQLKKNR